MPDPYLDEATRMAAAYGVVALAAVPVAGVAWVATRGSVWPRWRRWVTPLTGADVLLLFLASQAILLLWFTLFERAGVADVFTAAPDVAPDAVGAAGGGPTQAAAARLAAERRFWVGACAQATALPTFLLVWAAFARVAAGRGVTGAAPRPRVAADVLVGVLGWAVITPVTFAVYFGTLWVQELLGGTPDEHALKQTGVGDAPGRVAAFVLSACVFPAVYEELVFRRILLPWAIGRTHRAWGLMILAAVVSGLISGAKAGPLGFAAVLCGGLFVLQRAREVWPRFPVRTAGGIYATAALFGLLHSQVWPSPVPLFVFGLGVGYIAARTGSVWPAVVAHGLFNAVSVVYMLRGAG